MTVRQTCTEHSRYRTTCDDCRVARRAYHADLQERRGVTVIPRSFNRTHVPSPGPWAQRGACIAPDTAPHCDRHDQLRPGCEDCTAARISLFFDGGGRGHALDFSAAIAICNVCPVKAQCLDHAITAREEFGVWGGLDPDQRRKERRRRRQQARRQRESA